MASLVNYSLKCTSSDMQYAEIFCWKNVSSFCSAKATHIFSAKNIRILYIESAKTVNEMTLNELVKLTRLWTTGPWFEFNGSIFSKLARDVLWVWLCWNKNNFSPLTATNQILFLLFFSLSATCVGCFMQIISLVDNFQKFQPTFSGKKYYNKETVCSKSPYVLDKLEKTNKNM